MEELIVERHALCYNQPLHKLKLHIVNFTLIKINMQANRQTDRQKDTEQKNTRNQTYSEKRMNSRTQQNNTVFT